MHKLKVFIDTNILIDVLEVRDDYLSSLEILQLALNGNIELFASDITFINIAYICRKSVGMDKVYDFLRLIRKFIEVVPIGSKQIDEAISFRHKDFEDYIQYTSAKDVSVDFIVTRNPKDFKMSDIEVLSPKEFIKRYTIQ